MNTAEHEHLDLDPVASRNEGASRKIRRQLWVRGLLLVLGLSTIPSACTPLAARPGRCELRIGTSGDYAPFSEEKSGGYEGLDVDLAGRLAADLGCSVRFVPFRWPELLTRFGAGDFDLVMSGLTMRWERALAGRYTRPYAFTGAVAVIRSDSPISAAAAVDDLDQPGLRITVSRGGHLERVARERFRRAELRTVEDNRTLLSQLATGAADAVVSDSAEVSTWQGADIRVIGPFTHDAKAFLLPASEVERARTIDEWLVAREADGWLQRARATWLGSSSALDATRVTCNAVAALIQLRLALMPAIGAAKRAANLPITDRAHEVRVLERVRALASREPRRVLAVYRELIEIAKVLQQHPSGEPSATVEALRDAVARIDEQLVPEIERVPARSQLEWLSVLTSFVTARGVDAGMRTRLAAVLSNEG